MTYKPSNAYKCFNALSKAEGAAMAPGFDRHRPLEAVYFNTKGTLPTLIFWIAPDGTVSGLVAGCER